MKKKFLLLSVLALLCGGFTSCEEDEKEPAQNGNVVENPVVKSALGTLTVQFMGQEIVTENVASEFFTEKDGTMTLSLIEMKFVPQMPISITPVVSGISQQVSEADQHVTLLSGDGIVPTFGGNLKEDYVVTDFKGTLASGDAEELSFSCKFGNYPTTYKAKVASVR